MNHPSLALDVPAASRPKKHWSESRAFFGAVVLSLVVVSIALWWQLSIATQRLRDGTLAQAHLRAAQVTSAAASAVSILFRTVDVTARELAAAYGQGRSADFEQRVRLAIERLPPDAVHQVGVIGSDGYLAYSSLAMSGRVYLGDREHFKVHLHDGPERLFISVPLLGRVSQQWSIQFSRPIMRDGRFAGVVVLSVSPAYLQAALADVTLDSDDVITVMRQSGEYLARNRDMESSLGKRADASRPFLASGAPASGTFLARSSLDEIERIAHWQRLENYPVTVLVGLSSRTVLQSVERSIAEDHLKTAVGIALLWGAALGMTWLTRRVNAQGRRRDELEYVAMNDALTGLRSRHALMQYLSLAIARASATGQRVGVLYLDLDGFKPVNDRYGHAAGDQVLQAVGGRIKSCVRSVDFAARIGGDEFVVVIDRLQSDEALANLSQRIGRALKNPIAVSGVELQLGASIGLAVFPDHGASADALLVHADHQMYRQKSLVKQRAVAPG